ncbi:MAG: aldolase/citrate lyase family protein, partial [bacterium]|nr:aldolase/citrate lyase family protein [bacterium]
VFDMEHGVIGIESVEMMAQAVSGTNTVPLVRVPWNDFVGIKQILDTGVMGLIIPMINTPEQAQQAVMATRYPPHGIRGIGPHRASGFGRWIDQYFENANDNILVVIQIEHKLAVENLEEILAVEGIDCVFIGANDLAASMGHLKNPKHPEVQSTIDYINNVCRAFRIPCGLIATASEIDKRIKEGFQFIAVGHDISLLRSACESVFSEIKSIQK